jgi:hypothetical protein
MIKTSLVSRRYSRLLLARTLARMAQARSITSRPKNGVTGQAPCKANMMPAMKLTPAANPITNPIAQGFNGRFGSINASRKTLLVMV